MTQTYPMLKNSRVYVNGYDWSGYVRSFGPLSIAHEEGTDDPLNASLKGVWLGNTNITPSSVSAIFDNTATTGIHALASTQVSRTVLIAMGTTVPPAVGDMAFAGQFMQTGYTVSPGENPSAATITFSGNSGTATSLVYPTAWGKVVHALGAETAANSANGFNSFYGETTKGGYMVYQVTTAAGTGDITATLKLQHCATVDGVYADLLSTGSINCGSGGTAVPTSGVVALANTATVYQFLRWQIVLTTATSVTFALAFIRGF